jgi:hypothetical protein
MRSGAASLAERPKHDTDFPGEDRPWRRATRLLSERESDPFMLGIAASAVPPSAARCVPLQGKCHISKDGQRHSKTFPGAAVSIIVRTAM